MKKLGTTKLLKGLCFASMIAGPAAFAESQEYLWKGQDFRAAGSCHVKSVDDLDLRILEEVNSVQDLRGLIRVKESNHSFELIAVSAKHDNKESREFLKGQHLSSGNEKDLSAYVLKVTSASSLKIGNSGVRLQGAHFQVATEDNGVVTYSCGLKDRESTYIAFDVFVADKPTAVARVGVEKKDLGQLFKSVEILPVDEAEESLNQEQAKLQEKGKLPETREQQFRRSGNGDVSMLKEETAAKPEARASGGDSRITAKKASATVGNVRVSESSYEQVLCSNQSINVLGDDLSKTLFQVASGETVQVVQSFGNDRQVRGTKTYLKVAVGSRSGWVESSQVKAKGDCVTLPEQVPVPEARPVREDEQGMKAAAEEGAANLFPTIKRPTTSYKTAQRRFKAGRKGGRLHAACDLYRVKGEKTQAVSAGKVIRAVYPFYQGTYATELLLKDGRVARYGELTGKKVPGISDGKSIKVGQNLGFIGKVNSGCCEPMLHFEMYKGTQGGPLTQKWRKGFQRRSDLIDATAQLQKWEKSTFGASY